MSPLEAALYRPVAWKVSKPKRQPFYKTVTASKQRIYRQVIEKLPTGEWRVMRFVLNRWFRHEGRNVAPGYEAIADGIGYTVRQVRRLVDTLTAKGFITVSGGVGRGNRKHFRVDLWAILSALAPSLLESEKGDISTAPYKQELKIGRRWYWFAGIVGRSANFAWRLARSLNFDKRHTSLPDPSQPQITDTLIANLGWDRGYEAAEA